MSTRVLATDPITAQIKLAESELDRETKGLLKKFAKEYNCSTKSLIWCLVDVYSGGHMRSNAFCDVPAHVISDGLVVECDNHQLAYTPWTFTEKGKKILEPIKNK